MPTYRATSRFWDALEALPAEVQELAHKNFALLKADSSHPSLELKRVGKFWSARVGMHYRTLAVESEDGLTWVWIGTHAQYDRMLGR